MKRLTGKIDRVLVDAPCSGLGTLRRNPDLKWRQSPQSIEELKRKQSSHSGVRRQSAQARRQAGLCHLQFLPEENQEIIDRFLNSHPQFIQLNCAEVIDAAENSPGHRRIFTIVARLAPHGWFFRCCAGTGEEVKHDIATPLRRSFSRRLSGDSICGTSCSRVRTHFQS